ncbi:MAG: hypothetical protein JNJ54_15885 [Myxococcaceae bacterium]|nr:hypothetical protein [Myxococcaceae bacterium]
MKPFALAHAVLSMTAVVLLFAAPWHEVADLDFPCLAPDCRRGSAPGSATCFGTTHFSELEAGLVIGAFTLGAAAVVVALRRRVGLGAVLLPIAGAALAGLAGFYTLVRGSLAHLFSRQTTRFGESAFAVTAFVLVVLSLGLAIGFGVVTRRQRRA